MDGTISRAELISELYTKNGISLTGNMYKTLNKRLDLIEFSDGAAGFLKRNKQLFIISINY